MDLLELVWLWCGTEERDSWVHSQEKKFGFFKQKIESEFFVCFEASVHNILKCFQFGDL